MEEFCESRAVNGSLVYSVPNETITVHGGDAGVIRPRVAHMLEDSLALMRVTITRSRLRVKVSFVNRDRSLEIAAVKGLAEHLPLRLNASEGAINFARHDPLSGNAEFAHCIENGTNGKLDTMGLAEARLKDLIRGAGLGFDEGGEGAECRFDWPCTLAAGNETTHPATN